MSRKIKYHGKYMIDPGWVRIKKVRIKKEEEE